MVGKMLCLSDRFCPNHYSGFSRFQDNIIRRVTDNVNVNVNVDIVSRKGSLPLYPLRLSRLINKRNPDFFYSIGFMPPIFSKIPVVITVHDLMHMDFYTWFHKFYYKHILKRLLRSSLVKIHVNSFFTRSELINRLSISPEKIEVIYPGLEESVVQPLSEKLPVSRYGSYFLYVGNNRYHKNIPRMLEAFAKMPRIFNFCLVTQETKDLHNLIYRIGIQDRVFFLQDINNYELGCLYQQSVSVVYASLCEGFGFVAIEALANGVIPIVPNKTACPEVCGEYCLQVDPFSVSSIYYALNQAVKMKASETLEDRLARSNYAKRYSWDSCAKQTWSSILKHVEYVKAKQ